MRPYPPAPRIAVCQVVPTIYAAGTRNAQPMIPTAVFQEFVILIGIPVAAIRKEQTVTLGLVYQVPVLQVAGHFQIVIPAFVAASVLPNA
jgi:hypothetical protein